MPKTPCCKTRPKLVLSCLVEVVSRQIFFVSLSQVRRNIRCTWAGETCVNYPDFFRIISFMLFTVLLSLMCFFRSISDS